MDLMDMDVDELSDLKPKTKTTRRRIRDDITTHTKSNKDAFLLANKAYFLPLLPAANYIQKLETSSDPLLPNVVPYVEIAQPEGYVTPLQH